MIRDRSGMHYVGLVGVVLVTALVLSARVTAADHTEHDEKPARQAQVNRIVEIESRFSPAQRKYLEALRWLVGISRTPNMLVQACDERFPIHRDRHHQALLRWNATNQVVVEEIEKRRAVVVSIRALGNIVQIAEAERAFNASVAKTTLAMFSNDDNDKNRALCADLGSVLASAYFDLQSSRDDSMHASTIGLIGAVSPSQLEAWYRP